MTIDSNFLPLIKCHPNFVKVTEIRIVGKLAKYIIGGVYLREWANPE